MTLDDYLSAAYSWRNKLGVADDPAAACAAAGIDKATLTARRDNLKAVEGRCIVSKVGREFLDRVLALMP